MIYLYVRTTIEKICGDKQLFVEFLRLFLICGALTIAFGLYQVFAGFLNTTIGTDLYVGIYGINQVEFAGMPFGRPYAFLHEPDYYGEICMFFFFFSLLHFGSKNDRLKKIIRIVFFLSVTGTIFALVRAAMLGMVIGILGLVYYRNKMSAHSQVMKKIILAIVIIIIMIPFIPQETIERRFNPEANTGFTSTNGRILQVLFSLNQFVKKPIIGYGTNSFATIGIFGWGDESYVEAELRAGKLQIQDRYDPNIITTVLLDIGIVGMIIFIIIIITFIKMNLKYISINENVAPFFVPIIIQLFVVYQFTTAFWSPQFWICLGCCMGILEAIKKETECNNERVGN
jgi:O-antigen ligase